VDSVVGPVGAGLVAERVSESRRPTFFLVDGHALAYRAFYAMINRPLRTSRGENTSAPWGVTQFLLRLVREYEPDSWVFVFDAGGRETFRHSLYEPYKATREKLDEVLQEDFDLSLRRIVEILEAFRVPIVEVPGYEADDVIATLAVRAAERGWQAVIVSGDKDFYQLIRDGIALLNPGRGGPAAIEAEWVDLSNAAERLGVPPERVTDYLALVGDASDNVPGVRGVGPKTAAQLIGRYGSLESILEHADDVAGKRAREALRAHAEEARLSKALVTLRTDLPIDVDPESFRRREPDRERLRRIFLELEFHSLVREVASPALDARADAGPAVELVRDADALRRWVGEARARGRVAVEVVAEPGRVREERFVGLALAADPGRAIYLPVGHLRVVAGREDELPLGDRAEPHAWNWRPDAEAWEPLRALLADPEVRKVGEDLKRAWRVLRGARCDLDGLEADVTLASYCLDPGRRAHDLVTLALEKLRTRCPAYDELAGVGRRRRALAELDPDEAAGAAGARAAAALRLADRLLPELRDYGLERLFREIEMPLLRVLADMEWRGVRIDVPFFRAMGERLARELRLVEEEIYKVAGGPFNINSPLQLREVLFERLGLPVVKRTKTGPSTDAEVLEELAQLGHALPRLLLEYRELAKLKSTYVDALPALVNPETGRVHTSFNQAVAATGRLSSSEPNLQNIPARTPLGAEIRKGFVPAEGWLLLSADYSQIELRILAHLSHDPAFVEAFRRGGDIHRETAAILFGVPPDKVTPAMRAQAKTINFATIYGQGAFSLARQLGISVADAQRFIDEYFERFRGIRAYLDAQIERAREQGYVETLFGRRRYVPELQSRNPSQRGFGERVATNSPIQGSAADLIKLAMVRLHAALRDRGYAAKMILQVHDELLFEAPPEEMEDVRRLVVAEMEGVVRLDVPIVVEAGVGTNWYECKQG
jgi:DNA polymerase-1